MKLEDRRFQNISALFVEVQSPLVLSLNSGTNKRTLPENLRRCSGAKRSEIYLGVRPFCALKVISKV